MSSLGPKLRLRAEEAVVLASRFLTARQDGDGYWRDYDLEPGRSEAWITACTGYALSQVCQLRFSTQPALDRAAMALHSSRRPEGWGYNRNTACDADSTSWAIRFLAQIDAMGDVSASELLAPYVTPSGSVRTFRSPDRFGRWAWEHDEVAPLAGLALLAGGEPRQAIHIRSSILSNWMAGDEWKPFWWRGSAYVSAQSLTLLIQTGGIPDRISTAETSRLLHLPATESTFEMAQRIVTATHVVASEASERLCGELLAMQLVDGGWPSSLGLLVPSQRGSSGDQVFSDDRRLLSTAMSVIALTSWQQSDMNRIIPKLD